MRIFAISDLHIDYRPNLDWVMSLSQWDYTEDILLLAGDLSDRVPLQEQCFRQLSSIFAEVFFVPGNHDIWVKRKPDNALKRHDSISKCHQVQEIAMDYGLNTGPARRGDTLIVPLLSWYDYSFGEPNAFLEERWMDYYLCEWPGRLGDFKEQRAIDMAVCDYFLGINRALIESLDETGEAKTVISMSHFLPRIDVMPEYIPLVHQQLYPVLGSMALDEQVRQLGASIHVYGHSHVNRDVTIKGLRYINNAFGSPGEERISRKTLYCISE